MRSAPEYVDLALHAISVADAEPRLAVAGHELQRAVVADLVALEVQEVPMPVVMEADEAQPADALGDLQTAVRRTHELIRPHRPGQATATGAVHQQRPRTHVGRCRVKTQPKPRTVAHHHPLDGEMTRKGLIEVRWQRRGRCVEG